MEVLAIKVADIVEENGKTIRQNNQEKRHNIPVGSLVEVKYENWFGDGACEKVRARLWVISLGRDCDGTPLYTLCKNKPDHVTINMSTAESMLNDVRSGYAEESLTVIEVTEDLKRGVGALEWRENNVGD